MVLLKSIILLKSHSFNIQKYGLSMYFSTSQKNHFIFLPPSRLFAYLVFRVLKQRIENHFFNYLLPDPVKEG